MTRSNLYVWFSLSIIALCAIAIVRGESTAGSPATRESSASELSVLEEAKRFGYIPSRGRKSDELQKSGEGGEGLERPGSFTIEDPSKRVFHGARGKKVAMFPMYPSNSEYQWKRASLFPGRNMYQTSDRFGQLIPVQIPVDGGVLPRAVFYGGQGKKENDGDEEESDEEVVPAAVFPQRFASNQPFYSLVPAKEDEAVGKRMVYYTSRG